MNRLTQIGFSDFRLIFRDPSLRIFLVMPALIFAVVLILLPYLMVLNPEIENYVPLVIMGAMMQSSIMFGFIYSMVFIHEKEISVAKVYGILPISQTQLLYFRLLIPFTFAVIVTFTLLLWQPFLAIDILSVLGLALLCGLMSPVLAISVSVLSQNKMEGMTWFKLVNLVIVIPLAAYFVPFPPYWFGVVPTHWAYQMLEFLARGESVLWPFLIGLIYTLVLLRWMVKRFISTHFS